MDHSLFPKHSRISAHCGTLPVITLNRIILKRILLRVNRDIKISLRAYVEKDHRLWDDVISGIIFGLNSSVQESLGVTPARLFLGRELRGRLNGLIDIEDSSLAQEWIQNRENKWKEDLKSASKCQAEARERHRRIYNNRHKDKEFDVDDYVLLLTHPHSSEADHFSSKLAPRWCGPFKIMSKISSVIYELNDGEKSLGRQHISNLKEYNKREDVYKLSSLFEESKIGKE